MAKSISFIILLLLLAAPISAQTTVPAEDILRSIDEGRIVEYRGVEIIGDLDFTTLKDRESKIMPNEIHYHVRVPVLFEDCVFRGDVIAYCHEKWKNRNHIVIFHEDAIFHGCEFHMDSAFKYSRFNGIADFKYTKFPRGVSFKNCIFQGDASFKYAEISEPFNSEGLQFRDSVDSKHTKLEGRSLALDFYKK